MGATEAEIPIPGDLIEASIGGGGDASSVEDTSEDGSKNLDITIIPPCILNCVYGQFLLNGCAHTDYLCFCFQMNAILLEPEVQLCLWECPFLGEQLYAQGSIMDFCEVHGEGVALKFPGFMSEHAVMHRRQFSSSAVPLRSAAQPTSFTTITSTLSWGYTAYIYTQPEGEDGTATVVFAAQDTAVLTTFVVTSTIASGAAAYTSTFTDNKSAAITKVIGIPSSGSSTKTTPTSSPGSSPSPNTSPNTSPSPGQSSSGLSSGAKIGIGVAVPLVLILFVLGLFWFLRRRKSNQTPTQPEPQETGDGGLPEPMSTIKDLGYPKTNPPSYRGELEEHSHVEAGGVPIHEMNASNPLYDSHGDPAYRSQELNGNQQRYEANSNPVYPSHELTAENRQPEAPSPGSPTLSRKPVPQAETSTSSFPPPWDRTGMAPYEQDRNVGPSPEQVAEDEELAALEAEVTRVKQQRERLEQLQALEAREEQLKRSILERKKGGGSKP